MKRRILSLLLVLTLLLALPVAAAADEAKEVTLTLTKDTWTYTDTVTFSVKGPDDEDVPNGEVEVRSSMDHVFCHVNKGVAEISASVLISKLELTLGQKTEISVNYIPGSGSDYGPKSGQTSITVNESTLPTCRPDLRRLCVRKACIRLPAYHANGCPNRREADS